MVCYDGQPSKKEERFFEMKIFFIMLVSAICFCGRGNNGTDMERKEHNEIWRDEYANILLEKQNASIKPLSFMVKDINNYGVPELIICVHGTCLQIYTFDTGELINMGEHEFYTGTIRYLISENKQYSGIFCYFVSGGLEHYYYLEVNDNLEIQELWNNDFTGISKTYGKKRKKVKYISDDKLLIEESKKVIEKDNDISFLRITENTIKELRDKSKDHTQKNGDIRARMGLDHHVKSSRSCKKKRLCVYGL